MKTKFKRFGALLLVLAFALALFAGCENVDKLEAAAEIIQEIVDAEHPEISSSDPGTQEAPLIVEPAEQPASPEAKPEETEPAKPQETEPVKPQETEPVKPQETEPAKPETPAIDKDGEYTSKDDVALYILTYGCLPKNFVTKKEAQAKGWNGGSLEPYYPGCSIGGDHFGNYEGLLPKKSGRSYTECDIDTKGAKSRGAKRIVFSNDGLIYYTDDHYESFTLLYGEE